MAMHTPGHCQQYGGTDPAELFEPSWDDNPTWEGSELYSDLATAQVLSADAYVLEMYPVQDEDDRPGDLVWVRAKDGWELTDGDNPTPVSINVRPVRGRPPPPGTMTAAQQLALASEFRVPIPQGSAGGCGEVVVKQDLTGDAWGVTDGALTGLQAWIDGEGWRYVSDVGRAAAFRRTREEALLLAHQVAELEAACYQAEIAATRPEEYTGPSGDLPG
ncbi:hypothetical protein ACFXKF_32310 [Streptomyces scopuliridis]|uniref:hypothetical protein n=1 Tax=Streptomyces scopuliridis TaxID=452529 RepID=UPI0036C2E534